MTHYYECTGDALFSDETKKAMGADEPQLTDAFTLLGVSAGMVGLDVSDLTRERLHRLLTWTNHMDALIDGRGRVDERLETYEQAAAALAPEPWAPAADAYVRAPKALLWAEITRSAFAEGDISEERRSQTHRTAVALGYVAAHKMVAPSVGQYIRTIRTESILVADMITGCLSDAEANSAEGRGVGAIFRYYMRLGLLADSMQDLEEDYKSGITIVPDTAGNMLRLMGAYVSDAVHVVAKSPRSFYTVARAGRQLDQA
jgi:hypothetical protein